MNKGTFSILLEPILDPYSKSYRQIVTCSMKPYGPLEKFVGHTSFSKLSSFQESSQCIYFLRPIDSCDSFMTSENIPSLLSYLESNGYVIHYDYMKIVKKSQSNLVCICSFVENV
jgi:hypothetical protein